VFGEMLQRAGNGLKRHALPTNFKCTRRVLGGNSRGAADSANERLLHRHTVLAQRLPRSMRIVVFLSRVPRRRIRSSAALCAAGSERPFVADVTQNPAYRDSLMNEVLEQVARVRSVHGVRLEQIDEQRLA